ncbi:SHOCT domain-containing protein [Candidatus Gracilibacteria bacterium]|nr:SHOCT domain-containing protein [Candidatus Gracilibacteria bacterium]
MYHGQMMANQMSVSGVLLVILWVAIMYFIFASMRMMQGRGHHHRDHGMHHNSEALDILKTRYAKGEIQKEEFDIKKRDLSE